MTKTLIYGIIALIVVIVAAVIAFMFGDTGNLSNDSDNNRPGLFESLFPFGTGSVDNPLFEGEGGEQTNQPTGTAPVLRQVSQEPASGGFMFERNGQTYIRFVNRSTGHVFETVATSTVVSRVTNTTVPGIQEVTWVDENNFIVRYLNEDAVETFLARLSPNEEGEQRLNGVFLEPYTRTAIDPQRETLFTQYISGGRSSFILSEPDGANSREIFTSPITSWVPLQSENALFIYSAPLSNFDGFLYQIAGGNLIKITGNVPGLMAQVSPNGQHALISSGETNNFELFVVDIETGDNFLSPVHTLTDKCVFSDLNETTIYCGIPDTLPTGEYPNDWLLGRISFTDSIWSISTIDETATLLSDPQNEVGHSIDVWQPTLSPTGSHLLFINKNDLSLWSLELQTEEGI